MSEMKNNQTNAGDDGRNGLKKAIIIFAIIEALVLLPVLFRLLTR